MLYGFFLSFTSYFFYSVSDSCIKFLNGSLPAHEVVSLGALWSLIVLPFVKEETCTWKQALTWINWRVSLIRAVSLTFTTWGSVVAFTHLSMADAFSLIFTLPIFSAILSFFVLPHEKLKIINILSIITGFIGVLIVLRPGFQPINIGHVGAIIAGFGGAINIVLFRREWHTQSRVIFYLSGTLGPLLLNGVLAAPVAVWPTLTQWSYLVGYGGLAGTATILTLLASRHINVVGLSVPQYSQMIWGILFGYFFFKDIPNWYTLIGCIFIVSSSLLLLKQRVQEDRPKT